MTLPTVINNYKKQEVVTRLKKFYSTFNNALLMSVSENEDMIYWKYPNKQNDAEQMSEFVNKYLFPYFVGIKECKANEKDETCKNIVRNLLQSETSNFPAYIFSDGGCFTILPGGSSDTSGMLHAQYDINCLQKPNKPNRDIFSFTISHSEGKGFKLTIGSTSTHNLKDRKLIMKECKNEENSPHSKGACGALIYHDGWQIKDDYPYKL